MSESYIIKKALERYYDATIDHKLEEPSVDDLKRSDNFIYIFAQNKIYTKRIL